MSISTDRIARACAIRPKRTLAAWLVAVLVSFVVIALLLGDALTSDGDVTSNPESKRAEALINESFPPIPTPSEIVVVRSDRYTVDDPVFEEKVRTLSERGEALGVVAEAQTYYASEDESLVSKDRHATMVPLVMRSDEITPLVELVQSADGQDGFQVAITGSLTADADFERLSEEDLQKGELLIGLPAALIILLLVFGAVVAGLVPVLLGLLSIVIAIALTALVGQAFEVSFFVVNMITAMGLALGIDYALFIISRFREERGRGWRRSTRSSRPAQRRAGLCSSAGSPSCSRCAGCCSCPTRSSKSRAGRDPGRHRLGTRGGNAAARSAELARRPGKRAADPRHRPPAIRTCRVGGSLLVRARRPASCGDRSASGNGAPARGGPSVLAIDTGFSGL